MLAGEAVSCLDRIVTATHPMTDGADVFAQMVADPAQHIKVVLTDA
jgi:hypothetical protein